MWHFAVIGDPIEHSLSPRLHTYLMKMTGISGDYSRIHVQTESDLKKVISKIETGELDGINITSPWKSKAVDYADDLTPEAKAAGVINTIARDEKGLVGHNTDIFGFVEALQRNFGISNYEVPVVLGAGDSSRAVLLGLEKLGFEKCTILNRTIRNTEILVKSIDVKINMDINKLLDAHLDSAFKDSDLIINTLPGYGRKIFKSIPLPTKGGAYFDLVYAAEHLEVLRKFQHSGWNVCDGLDMLIYQGIAALEYWTGKQVTNSIEMTELRDYLRKGDSNGD
ncbi:MAG: Shikimate dehydrogenase (NADP(+)) [Candidatus Marinimicrobia bacterium]|nr:Shikimate dehydrogenase (NADP(+)) [Candidatus Neomarinimicrobiota bacterium]